MGQTKRIVAGYFNENVVFDTTNHWEKICLRTYLLILIYVNVAVAVTEGCLVEEKCVQVREGVCMRQQRRL